MRRRASSMPRMASPPTIQRVVAHGAASSAEDFRPERAGRMAQSGLGAVACQKTESETPRTHGWSGKPLPHVRARRNGRRLGGPRSSGLARRPPAVGGATAGERITGDVFDAARPREGFRRQELVSRRLPSTPPEADEHHPNDRADCPSQDHEPEFQWRARHFTPGGRALFGRPSRPMESMAIIGAQNPAQ